MIEREDEGKNHDEAADAKGITSPSRHPQDPTPEIGP